MSSIIPEKVVRLAQKIETRDPVDFSFLKETIAGAGISANEFENNASFTHPPDQSYGRILLHESRRLKIFLMCWTPGDFTAIHDHGSTDWGCVFALGDFTHRLYQFEDGLLRLKSNSPFGEGQVACLTGDLIHMMGNTGNKNIMSLHIYGSDSGNESLAKKSRVYLPESRKVITTNGPAFLNCPREAIIREEAFSAICSDALDDYLNLLKMRVKLAKLKLNRQQEGAQSKTEQYKKSAIYSTEIQKTTMPESTFSREYPGKTDRRQESGNSSEGQQDSRGGTDKRITADKVRLDLIKITNNKN